MPLAVRAEAIAGSLGLPGIASPLPCEVYLWPSGRSYTGQPVAEIHTLGSPPLLEAVVRTLCAAGARLAEPGEFTLRAFLAGRIDLTQAEAVLGVIDAANPEQLDVALSQLAGGLAEPLNRLRDRLLDLLADLEAGLDFADEDLPAITDEELAGRLREAAAEVARLGRQMASRGEAAPAVRAVLVGWPNVGKSSLFNALTRQAGALVSEQPGTTRDYLTAELDLGGVKCQLIDTAGMGPEPGDLGWPGSSGSEPPERRQSGGSPTNASRRCPSTPATHPPDLEPPSIEQAAQAAARQQSRQADVRIFCLDSTRPLNEWEQDQLEGATGGVQVVVLTKIDVGSGQWAVGSMQYAVGSRQYAAGGKELADGWSIHYPLSTIHCPLPTAHCPLPTSSVTGEGIDALRDELRCAVLSAGASGAEAVAGTAVRCRESLRLAAASLRRARRIARHGTGEELVAAEVRVALGELGKVVGAVYTDDVLERIFSRFCIGK
jgi:tRNA modification GTPase